MHTGSASRTRLTPFSGSNAHYTCACASCVDAHAHTYMQMLLASAVAILVAAREVCVCYWANCTIETARCTAADDPAMRRRVFSSGWNLFSDYLPSISRTAASVRALSRIHSPHTHTQLLDTCMGISHGATRHGVDVVEEQDYHVAHSVWNLWWLHVSPLFRFFAPPHREASSLNTGTSSRLLQRERERETSERERARARERERARARERERESVCLSLCARACARESACDASDRVNLVCAASIRRRSCSVASMCVCVCVCVYNVCECVRVSE